MLGRIFALEVMLLQLGQTSGYYIANILLDGLGLSPRGSCVPLAVMGFVPTAVWAIYYLSLRVRSKSAREERSMAHTDEELEQLHACAP